jgi:hypothetical protein
MQTDARPDASGAASSEGYRLQVNTNLEQISDWLTKIIVGLGLIQLGKLPGYLVRASSYVGQTFGKDDSYAHFACALLLYFSVMGFTLGYLLTRLYLTGAFAAADRAAMSPQAFREELERAARTGDKTSQGVPSDSQVAAAERVGQLALRVDEPVIRQQVEALAREYERTRSSMRAGSDRTRRLDEIVVRMRTLGLAARFLLPELTVSNSPGLRLTAIALVAVTPEHDYLEWLIDRFQPTAERPFVVYHAAVALCSAAGSLDPADVKPAIERAQEMAKQLRADAPRDNVLAKAMATVEARLAGTVKFAQAG